ncbi:MAG: hypothetical protein Q9184_003851 [Pyrenodesmia sp. 2 TL-2023]
MDEDERPNPLRRYQLQEETENLERYYVGGYHPVKLGDEYSDGRYCVVHKLGFGSYSTVWLAKDRHSKKHVALKIMMAADSRSSNEGQILRLLEEHRKSRPDVEGGLFVSKLLHEFTIDGPNGRHTCLVSEPLGCSVSESKEGGDGWLFPLHVARAIAARIVMGLNFVHDAGIVHGDLHTGNIFFRISDLNELSADELYQQLQPPKRQAIERVDGGELDDTVPPYAVVPLWVGKGCEDVTDTNLVVADFGEAYVAKEKPPRTLNTPILLCPPETLLKIGPIGMPADIWTLACTIFEILGESTLFEGFLPDADTTMREVVSALGKPPKTLWTTWDGRHEYFHEDGSWVSSPRGYPRSSRPLDMRISQMGRAGDENFTQAEQDALLQLLRGMLTYDPQERFTIADVVGSEWMEKFGKPAIQDLDTGPGKGAAAQPEQSQCADECSTKPSKSPSSSTVQFAKTLDDDCSPGDFFLQASDNPGERTLEDSKAVERESCESPTI